MATKAPVKSKKATVPAKSAKVTSPRAKGSSLFERFNREVTPQALLAELGGTFLLVSSVLFTSGDAFFTGITVLVLALSIFAISGAHLNPAVSFGLWTARKISAVRMVSYWIFQFIGAIAAIVVIHRFSGLAVELSLSSFWQFDTKIFFAELFGAAVFLFGLTAAITRGSGDASKAVGIGLSLFLGLVIATGLLSEAVKGESSKSSDTTSVSRLQKVNNVTLNPAVAVALTERDTNASQSITGQETASDTVLASRLTLETVLGTLFGAAIGVNLYLLLAGVKREV